jgi:hypothetical protein
MPTVKLRYEWTDDIVGDRLVYTIEQGGEDAITDAVPPNWPPEFVEFVKEYTESIEDEVPKGSAAIATFSDFDDREPELVLE